jgi:hypothetical protein
MYLDLLSTAWSPVTCNNGDHDDHDDHDTTTTTTAS